MELSWEDPTLVLIDKWFFYRGGHLSRFGCISVKLFMNIKTCHYRKHCTCGCRSPKQSLIAMACDSKLHAKICVISVKLNIGKKITGLKIMALNHKKI